MDDDGAVTRPLAPALDDLRSLVGDGAGLVRAVATGHRRGMAAPTAERVEIRQVCLRSGPHLQAVSRTGPRVETVNAALGPAAATLVAGLLGEPFTTWHVETATGTVELRVTKRGEAQVHRTRAAGQVGAAGPVGAVGGTGGRLVDTAVPAAHDRVKRHLVPPEDPLFTVLGAGADKRRQVDAFVRLLAPSATALLDRSDQDRLLPDEGHPPVLRVADLGCGNAYLTFAAHRWLSGQAAEQGRAVHTVGVDVRADVVERSRRLAGEAGLSGLEFTVGTIADADPFGDAAPDVVVALHACDTASDEALARAVRWTAPLVLVAPCCHHDVQRQLQQGGAVLPFPALTRHAILRERFADVLTDALRALLLRLLGYRVDVVEFIDSRHTPRNTMIRAVRTGAPPTGELMTEYRELTEAFRVRPVLARMLDTELARVLDPESAPT